MIDPTALPPGSMVDITQKNPTFRWAIARARIELPRTIVDDIYAFRIPKGDVLAFARSAALQAVKWTPHLLPLCHPVPIEGASVEFIRLESAIEIRTKVQALARTGYEMEALTSASLAALTIYDLCKPLTTDLRIANVELIEKGGGKSGVWRINE